MDLNIALFLISAMVMILGFPAVVSVFACYNDETGFHTLTFNQFWPLQVVCLPFYYMFVRMLIDVFTIIRPLYFG